VEEKAAAERMSHRTDALWMKVRFREGCLPVDQARREVARQRTGDGHRCGGTEKPEGQQCELSTDTDSRLIEMSVM